jgi:hypothetical protein
MNLSYHSCLVAPLDVKDRGNLVDIQKIAFVFYSDRAAVCVEDVDLK